MTRPARLILVFAAGVFALVRLIAFTGEFGNNDIAGIAYNADLLLHGLLPYRDSVEFKSPAPFFLFAGIFELFGRDLRAVHVVYALWMGAGALGVWWAAAALWGHAPTSQRSITPVPSDSVRVPGSQLPQALAAGLYLLSAGHFDINYSSWMTPPYVWAFAALLWGLRSGRLGWHLGAGAFAAASFLFKMQAVPLVLVFPLAWWWARRQGQPGADRRAWLGWLAGGVAVSLPLVAVYAAGGALPHLWRSLFPVTTYAEHVTLPAIPPFELLWRVPAQLFWMFPLATAAAALGLVRGAWRVVPLAAFLCFSILAGGMGGPRFYSHYAIQFLPALALCAAAGLAGLATWTRAARLTSVGVAGALVGLQLVWIAQQGGVRFDYLPPRFEDGRTAAHKAGEHIRARTQPGETIHAWGWDAWPVYFWAERFAPTPMYKELGLVTTVNTNTFWTDSQPIHHRPGAYSDMLLRAFREKPPAYFVYSTYYRWVTGNGTEPLYEFEELLKILEEQYAPEAKYGNLQLYVRRDRGAQGTSAPEPHGGGPGLQ